MESLLLVVLYLSPSWVLLVMYMYGRMQIIENIKGKVMESVMPDVGGALGTIVPDFTGPAAPVQPTNPMPEGVGLGVPSF